MKPLIRFNSIVISITTFIMFVLWALLSSTIFTSIKVTLIVTVISYFTSIGFYRVVFSALSVIATNWIWFKKKIFGSYFFEGTWVGFFIGDDDKPKYFYEIHEQSLDSFVIHGRSFREDGAIHGVWKVSDPVIDAKHGKLMYYYEADSYRNTFINPGLGSFDFEREEQNSAPIKLIGFSSDLFRPGKLMAFEVKEDDKTIIDHKLLIEKAKKLYNSNRDYFKL